MLISSTAVNDGFNNRPSDPGPDLFSSTVAMSNVGNSQKVDELNTKSFRKFS